MKPIKFFKLLPGIIVVFCSSTLPIHAVVNPSIPITAAVNRGFVTTKIEERQNLQIAPGQIIVKIKENAAAKISSIPFANTAAGNDARLNAAIPTFSSFKEKHKVRSTERLFIQGTNEAAINDFPTHVNRIKSLFSQRTKRAAGDKTPRIDNIFQIILQDRTTDVLTACKELLKDTTIEYAVPNRIALVQYIPNDPMYSSQWSHQVSSAELAWDIERGQSGVVVAIVDCGIDYSHEDLSANMFGSCTGGCLPNTGYDFVDIDTALYKSNGYQLLPGEDYTTPDNDPMDFNGHGTHCGGIAAAVADNGIGITGIAPRIKLMPVRAGFSIKSGSDESGFLEYDDIANAIRYAADNGADVISMSFSGGADALQHDAIEYAVSLGVVLVAAAGNYNSVDSAYPAAYDHVISVAATAQNDNRAFYSNFGPWVDIAAPGGDENIDAMIASTVPRYGGVLSSPTGYRALQGTSMAAPYVAGVAALVISRNPTRTAEEVESIIERSVDVPKSNEYIGTGRVNVLKAVQTNIVHASVIIESPADQQFLSASSIPVIGTISTTGSATYKVFFGNGLYPASWNLLSTGTAPVSHGTLGTLNAGSIANGAYTIKVVVYAEADSIWKTAHVIVDQSLHSSWPQQINIIPSTWSNTVTLSDVNADGALEIFIGSVLGIFAYKGDGTALSGWPIYFTSGVGISFSHISSPGPAVADIDNDGVKEIVMLGRITESGDEYVYVYTPSGAPKTGFPVNLGIISSGSSADPVTLADLDNNGTMEIIYKQKISSNFPDSLERIAVLASDGKPFQKWPFIFDWYRGGIERTTYGCPQILSFDIDNDGKKEVIASTVKTNGPRESAPTMQSIYIINYDGTLRSGYPMDLADSYSPYSLYGVSPVMVDIDNDGIMEIGTFLHEYFGAFAYIKPNGVYVSGWPVPFENQVITSKASLADIDRDGTIETIFGTFRDMNNHGTINIFKSNGTVMNGWPIVTDAPILSPTIAVDIDSDGYPDVIVVDSQGKVYAWTYAGMPISGFPKICSFPGYTTDQFSSCPAVGDIDGDGNLELVVSSTSGKIFIWDLSGSDNKLTLQWPMDMHDPMHNCDVRDVNVVCNPSMIVIQPVNVTVTAPGTANFFVTASGTAPSVYQWQLSSDGGSTYSNISGATSSSYTTEPTSTSMNGYKYRCYVSNTCPSNVTSDAATLTVMSSVQKLSGTAFGTSPAYAVGREYYKATDGNTSTFFDYSTGSGGYTGIDLGSGNAKKISKVRFYPRASYASRMNGGKFQGSNTSTSSGYTNLYTIPSTPGTSWTEVTITNALAWRYLRYLSPTNGFCNVAEVEFYGVPTVPNNPPTIANAAAVSMNPITGTTVSLSVLGADDGGETNLTYTWATTGTVPAAVSFSLNSTNAAKNSTAIFTKAGTYAFQVTIQDQGGSTVISSVANVVVNQTLTSVSVTPASASVLINTTQQFTASARDQFSTALSPQPSFSWTISGGGSMSTSGLFTASGTTGGPYTVTATTGDKTGTASVTVTNAPTVAIAGELLVSLSAQNLAAGSLSSWSNTGTLGGSFAASGTAPTAGTTGGKNAVTFSGSNGMLASFTAPSSITGTGDWSVEVWAYNPAVSTEECMVQWADRGTTSKCAQFNYGSNTSYGAATHYGNDMGYASTPTAGTWHHLVLTYAGGTNGTEVVYVDGTVNKSRSATINLFAANSVRIAFTDNKAGGIKYYSGSIATVRVHSGLLTTSQVTNNFNVGIH